MKHLSRFLLASIFVLSFTAVQAQDENNPWAIGVGTNAVDLFPTGNDAPAGGFFEDYFNVGDHWNILPSVSRLSIGRYIGSGFVFEAAGSVNQIDKFGDERLDDLSYYAVDGSVNYSLRALLNEGWFDPFVGAGGGYTWLEDEGFGTLNGTLGFNFWFSENIALNLQTTYKHSFDDYEAVPDAVVAEPGSISHWQHVAGVKFIFGGVDTDGDGIYDKNDECPETPGLPEFNGCPDTDGDGIEDRLDACPNEPGLPEFDGCPDTDGDGIPDPQDECPTEAGLAEYNGCPDTDGDGVPDNLDECPQEAGPVENDGCPWPDSDGDGVPDHEDDCPQTAGTVENDGCPEPTAEIISELNEYSNTVLFDLNQSTIRPESQEALDAIAEIMEEYPTTIFHIEGHTDSTGSAEYNEQLSRERAQAVKEYLIEQGIPEERLTSEGYGETQPIASNQTAAGRQENRRVEISLDQDREMRNTETDTMGTGNNN